MPDALPASRGAAAVSLAATAIETLGITVLALWIALRSGSSLVWLLLPLLVLGLLRRSLSEHGLDLRLRPPSILAHFALGTLLLAGYSLLHGAFALAMGLHPVAPRIDAGLAAALIEELLVVGVPEEAFFRGYLQTRWDLVLGRPWRLAGARIGPGLVLQAVVFALCHLATGDWTRLRVFFFALLAGWLRARSGSILGPAVYHAVANVWFRLLLGSFR